MEEDLGNLLNGSNLSSYTTSASTGLTSGGAADTSTSALAGTTLTASISNDQLNATIQYPYYGGLSTSVASTFSDYSFNQKGMNGKLDDLMDQVKALTYLVKSLRPDLDMTPDSILGFLSINHPDILQKYIDHLDAEK